MKKLLYTLVFIFFISTPCIAQNVIVESLNDFSKDETETEFSAKVLEKAEFENGLVFEENSTLKGKILQVVDAKRGKRNGYILIKPVLYTSADETVIKNLEEDNLEAKVTGYSKKNFKDITMKAGVAAGKKLVKSTGAGQLFYFSKGLIMPEKGKSRLKSAVGNVYENTPFVYLEKGKEINIEKGDTLVLKFYDSDKQKVRKEQ